TAPTARSARPSPLKSLTLPYQWLCVVLRAPTVNSHTALGAPVVAVPMRLYTRQKYTPGVIRAVSGEPVLPGVSMVETTVVHIRSRQTCALASVMPAGSSQRRTGCCELTYAVESGETCRGGSSSQLPP